ncbi:dTDP-4-keto-6-deoxy-D-glucose epimerase [Actinobacteria bacterium YIM 96077]|uniref:dTDP-4-dehydrorhamnose 3,5-epimerase n=1 Tax=Phytoactinopolyspora halophila TaxID=1981511 RepID=A0A329QGS8_9ACTN|nr:dTDP-4-keto-6-deoxy-D-glucose epimerase [Actinobacteria bacterium YIM 96077]RAW11490.1 dTDP-4-dehydrorhamnose 3,5-epimerase [Phytoactinopolyspora halophila]
MAIEGAWTFTPRQFGDQRGRFLEFFRQDLLEAVLGHPLDLRQANCSISAAGVVRGVHFADVPPGQAKYVTCAVGAVLDVVIDLRLGSPTFGQWDRAVVDDRDRRAVYIAEGLGHAFMSLADGSTVMYLCSSEYAPERERGVHPFDADLDIDWPSEGRDGELLTAQLSAKDAQAPTLREARDAGVLPDYERTLAFYTARARNEQLSPASRRS